MKLINKWSLTNQLLVILGVAVVSYGFVNQPVERIDIPNSALPAECSAIEAPAGSSAIFRTYAIGTQVYRWNGASWAFVAPVANLYADAGFRGLVGTHYAGPTWESNSGSKVVARRLEGCTPDPNAIPWLLLESTSTEGPGIFNKVSYIQRLYTVGGLAPVQPGSSVGEERSIPYTAEYYFFQNRSRTNGVDR